MKFPQIKIPFPWFKPKPQISDFRIIFMASDEFAVPILKQLLDLERLLSEGNIITAVFTQPDKPAGRNKKVSPTPIKELALKYKVPVMTPEKIDSGEWIKKIKNLRPDLIIVCAYGQLIPKEILNIPKFGCINIHPSLLPKYRGSSPMQRVILDGEKNTGVTIMLLDEKLDHGPILASRKEKVKIDDTTGSLAKRLSGIGGKLLINFLPNYLSGNYKPKPQDHKIAIVTRELAKKDGKIDWNKSAEEIERQIRAFAPWPGTWSLWNSKILKIIQVQKCDGCKKSKPGKVFLTKKKKLAVNCGKDALIIEELQLEGKRAMGAEEFLRGHGKIVGSVLSVRN
ncbi:methionyl-tRNA formyltransferase [Patescibacteria group bacterium]|nr:methionyl-tRNA formyltransferase [Patescibacteria group bacterium]MBU4512980.1 methionyl-tRNA formyltransferase [Patescibacteria group bacterium]MCG2693016.1 methionyl-tRNA formyltransferase [Candidatus Parcubacteria bacterium]